MKRKPSAKTQPHAKKGPRRVRRTRALTAASRRSARANAAAPAPVTAAQLRALRAEIEERLRRPAPRAAPMRWNPDPEDVQKSVAQLVLTIVEFLRQLMERQAIRRMEQKTLTKKEVEAVGVAL